MNEPISIDLDTTLVRAPDLVHSEIDDEIVMMSVETGRYYSLSDVGARVWELLEEPTRVSSLCDRLRLEYRIDEARCRNEILTFVARLTDEGLVIATP